VTPVMEKQSNEHVLTELLEFEHRSVIDVGCGEGDLVRWMTKRGAFVTGVEVSPRALAKARAVELVGDEHYMQGIAEDLPIPDRTADIVIFFNSLHHVDPESLPRAMREAARVLRHGGLLYVSEPLPEGPYFELMKPAHDETVVREAAYAVLQRGPEHGFIREREFTHVNAVPIKSYDRFRDRITSINPETRSRFDDLEEMIQANFEKLGNKSDSGWTFDQPMRVTLLRKT